MVLEFILLEFCTKFPVATILHALTTAATRKHAGAEATFAERAAAKAKSNSKHQSVGWMTSSYYTMTTQAIIPNRPLGLTMGR